MKKIILILFILIISLAYYSNAFASDGVSISGRIYLPAGEVAPVGGISVTINYSGSTSNYSYTQLSEQSSGSTSSGGGSTIGGWGFASGKDVIIPYNTNYVDYTLNYPVGVKSGGMSFSIKDNTNGNFLHKSFNSINGRSFDLTLGSVTGADAYIDYATATIKGNIILPESIELLKKDLEINVCAYNDDTRFSGTFILPANQRNASFTLGVDKTLLYKMSYSVQYSAESTYQNIDMSTTKYLDSGGNTVNETSNFKIIDVSNQNAENVNMELHKSTQIKGRITLPNNLVAPVSGIKLSVNDVIYEIPEGENHVDYFLAVTPNSEYKIRSYIINKDDFDIAVYSGTTYLGETSLLIEDDDYPDNDARIIQVGTDDISNVNFQLLPVKIIQGFININKPYTNDISLLVIAQINYPYFLDFRTETVIKSGDTSAKYRIEVLEQAELTYDLICMLNSYNSPYLNDDTTYNLTTSNEINNLNFTLIPRAVLMSGRISLPSNNFAQEDIVINMSLKRIETNTTYYAQTPFTIKKGSNAVDYKIYANQTDFEGLSGNHTIELSAYGEDDNIVDIFNAKVISGELSICDGEETIFNITDKALNKDLTLIAPNKNIAGAISIDSPAIENININLSITNKTTGQGYDKSVTIPKGEISVRYTIGYLISDSVNIINFSYTSSSNDQIYSSPKFYLSQDGYSINSDEAQDINVSQASGLEQLDINLI